MRNIIFIPVIAIFMAGCTDASIGRISALGGSADITCMSGDTVLYKGISTGKVMSSQQSDGYIFVDKHTGRLVEVSGNCKIEYINY